MGTRASYSAFDRASAACRRWASTTPTMCAISACEAIGKRSRSMPVNELIVAVPTAVRIDRTPPPLSAAPPAASCCALLPAGRCTCSSSVRR
eukprot:1574598-Prymnesium_polylepis.1